MKAEQEGSKGILSEVLLEKMRSRVMVWLEENVTEGSPESTHLLGLTAGERVTQTTVVGDREKYEEGFTEEVVGSIARGKATVAALIEVRPDTGLTVGICAGGTSEIWTAPMSNGDMGQITVATGDPASPECEAIAMGLSVRESLRRNDRRGQPKAVTPTRRYL